VRDSNQAKVAFGFKMRRTRIEHILSALPPLATRSGHSGSAASCQERTHAVQQKASLLDHLIGAGKERGWDF
jgi:hypothetical protein